MSKNYPYIQHRSEPKEGICSICKIPKKITTLEWRVDWFQGNCEFEDICPSCLSKRENEERRKQKAWEKKMQPIWERQENNRYKREMNIKTLIAGMGLSLEEFDNGQWTIGGVLDWWTTTGTAIERKSKKRHHLSFKRPQEIIEILEKITK